MRSRESASLPDHRSLPNTMRSQRGLGLLLVSVTYVIIVRVSLSYPAFEWARRRVLTLRLRRRRLRRLTAGGATGVGSTGGTASLIGHWRRLLIARSSVPNQQWSQSAAIIPDNTIIEQHRLVKHTHTHLFVHPAGFLSQLLRC